MRMQVLLSRAAVPQVSFPSPVFHAILREKSKGPSPFADTVLLCVCFIAELPGDRFLRLLNEGKIKRPDKRVMRIIEFRYPMQMSVISTAEGAVDLYEICKRLPLTSTCVRFKEAHGITIGGAMFPEESDLLQASSSTGLPVMVKLLGGRQYRRRGSQDPLEAELCDLLGLSPWDCPDRHPANLIRASQTRMLRGEVDVPAVIMRRYASNLADLGQLQRAPITRGVLRLMDALSFIHSKGFVHMDVKNANVLLDEQGSWFLADFGSCVEIGEALHSYTDFFHPDKLEHKVAQPGLDWDFLLVLLLVEMNKDVWKERLFTAQTAKVDIKHIQSAVDALADSETTAAAGVSVGKDSVWALVADVIVKGTLFPSRLRLPTVET